MVLMFTRLPLRLAAAPNHGLGRTRAIWSRPARISTRLPLDLHVSVAQSRQGKCIRADGHRMTLSFVDFNGIVPEKFDAVELSHMVDAE